MGKLAVPPVTLAAARLARSTTSRAGAVARRRAWPTLDFGPRRPSTSASRHMTYPEPTETIDLWPNGAPGAPAALPVEDVNERSSDPAFNDRFVRGISRPRMAVFRPAQPNGAAVLITPGGGYSWVVIDKEGYEMARLLAAQGVTAFVLFGDALMDLVGYVRDRSGDAMNNNGI